MWGSFTPSINKTTSSRRTPHDPFYLNRHSLECLKETRSNVTSNLDLDPRLSSIEDSSLRLSRNSNQPQLQAKKTTDRIYSRLQSARFTQIFNSLGPSAEHLLKYDSLTPEALSTPLQDIIKPILEELVMLEETLTLEEFIHALTLLAVSLSPHDRHILLETPLKPAKISKAKR